MRAILVLTVLAIIGAAFGGYVANIVELVHYQVHNYSAVVVAIKAVGIVLPFVGAIAGWVD